MQTGLRLLCLAATFVVTNAGSQGGQCRNANELGLTFGHDASGYWIRTDLIPGALPPSTAKRWVEPTADFLASEAEATVLFVAGRTTSVLGPAEWRGQEPLNVFRAFCAAGGLEVNTSVPGLWVVVPRGDVTRAAVTVFAQPMNPKLQDFRPAPEIEAWQRVLVNQLTPQYLEGGDQALGVSYCWLPNEGPNTALVVASWLGEGQFAALKTKVFKVRIENPGSRAKLQCLWQSEQAWGALMPEIEDDFDGDGYRDFLFDPGTDEHHNAVILSGRTGTQLLQLRSGLLAIDRGAPGPRRVAARIKEDGHWTGHVLSYEREQNAFVEATEYGPAAKSLALGAGDSPRARLLETFVAAVGGRARVTVYAAPGWRSELTAADRDSDKITFVNWEPAPIRRIYYVEPQQVEKGRPSHILYRWESPAYQDEKRRELQRLQKKGGTL
jgi:hypothetical protein